MGSGKQQLEIISSEIAEHAAVFEKDRVGEFPFLLLEFGNLFLDGPFTDQAVGKHRPCLADTVSPVDRLHLDRRVPPGVQQKDVVGRCEIQAQTTGLEADQEDTAIGILLEAVDVCLAGARLPVQVFVRDACAGENRTDNRQHARELGDHECLVALAEKFFEERGEGVELG